MDYIPAINIIQAEFTCLFSGQRVQNVLHFTNGASPTPLEMVDLGAALVGWWSSDIRPLMCTAVSLIEVKLTDLTTQDGPVVNYGTGLPLVGTGGTDPLPNNCALVLTKRTAKRGRSYRGRVYHFGWGETNQAGNVVSPTIVNQALSAYNNLINFAVAEDTYTLGVLSRFTEGNPRTVADFTPVTGFTTDGMIDSQRRRLPGRGS